MIHTECGILLQISTTLFTEQEFVDKLSKLQHRGREAYGVANFEKTIPVMQKYTGTVKNNNHQNGYINKSQLYLGHTRYSTSGSKNKTELIQPVLLDTRNVYQNLNNFDDNKLKCKETPIVFAFNGNIRPIVWSNLLRHYPIMTESDNQNYNDTQKIKLLLEYLLNSGQSLDKTAKIILEHLVSSFCLIISTLDTTWVIRDSLGNRPLSIYTETNNNTNSFKNSVSDLIISSETNVITHTDDPNNNPTSNQWHNIEYNSILKINHSRHQPIILKYLENTQNNSNNISNHCSNQKFCLFEKIYFMNSKSILTDTKTPIVKYRHKLMNLLINQILDKKESKLYTDLFVNKSRSKLANNIILSGIPETGMEYAESLSSIFKMPLTNLIKKKDNYQYRTFICGNDKERYQACIDKYDIDTQVIKNKILVLVDDSIVRGNTLKYLITYIKTYKPKEIHILIPSPPVAYPCYYGVDIPTKDELIINRENTIENIRKELDITSLFYLDIERIKESDTSICDHCFTGKDIIDLF